jgi:hypothetical protein
VAKYFFGVRRQSEVATALSMREKPSYASGFIESAAARARSRQQLRFPRRRRASAGEYRPFPVERQEYRQAGQRTHARGFCF